LKWKDKSQERDEDKDLEVDGNRANLEKYASVLDGLLVKEGQRQKGKHQLNKR